MSVKVDKIPYTLQFCDTAGQVSFFFSFKSFIFNFLFIFIFTSVQILRRCYVPIPLMVCAETQAFVCRKFNKSVDNLFNGNGITVSLEQAFILLHMDLTLN